MIEKLGKIISFWAFFAGVLGSFFLLSMFGWMISKDNLFIDFSRNHRAITNETLFYPTARQISALVHEKLDPSKVSVIIAGSSVMRGAGQSSENLWSGVLQQALGGDYQVLNLALNGGGAAGMGLYAAEELIKEGRKVLLVSDMSIIGVGITPDNGPVYRGLYFDAKSRNMIYSFHDRVEAMSKITMAMDQSKYDELWLKPRINVYLNFDELWNYLGYRKFFTIWTPLMASNPWAPRNTYSDSEPDCDRSNVYKNFLIEEMAITRGQVNASPLGVEIKTAIDSSVPPELRPNLILAFNLNSPYYLNKLNNFEKDRYYRNFYDAKKVTSSLGFNALTLENSLNEDDYCDRVHFSASGGKKIAVSLAPKISEVAKKLGYVQ